MKRSFSFPVLFFMSAAALAQTAPTHANPDDIHGWLRSGDPRMIAWGASVAAEMSATDERPVLASLVEAYRALPPQQFDVHGNYVPHTPGETRHFDSIQAVLDALIQLHGTVTYEAITAILPDFPAQALTLFAATPEPERSQLAAAVYATRDRSDKPYDWHHLPHQQMVYLAAAILALNPPPEFTATLLSETTVALRISVTDDDKERAGVYGTATCGDSFAMAPASGWPQPHTYVVEQHWKSEKTPAQILVSGEPAITSRRARSNSSCSTLPGFSSVQRLLLLRSEAGLASSVGTIQYDTLRYLGPDAYRSAVSSMLERHREPLRSLAGALEEKALLSPAEVETAMPAFSVEILDERRNKTQNLPDVVSSQPI